MSAKLQPFVVILIIINGLFALIVIPLMRAIAAAHRVIAFGRYRDFDIAGVFNHEARKDFQNGRLSFKWDFSDYMSLSDMDSWISMSYLVTCAFVLNLVICIVLYVRLRTLTKRSGVQGGSCCAD